MLALRIRMISIWKVRCLAALLLVLGGMAQAELINNGESTGDLVKLSNRNGFGSSQSELTPQIVEGNAVLVVDWTGVPGDFSSRSVWYASTIRPTNAVYSVSARFLPQAQEAERRGGVMGWLNLASNKGLALLVVPEGPTASFRVATVDFNAESGADNESPAGLYGLNGASAAATLGSSWTELGNYSATQFAVFELQFTPASTSDLQALPNATARLKARVYQGTDASGNRIQVGAAIELLTDLPLPEPIHHRVGYYGYNGNIFADQGPVGTFDDLSGIGGFSKPNNPPTVALFVTAPSAVSKTVYDNATTSVNRSLFEGVEFGDQVVLDNNLLPICRLDSFIFQYVGKKFSGDETARIQFYKNDGPLGKPGMMIFDSGSFEIPAAPDGATVDLGDLGAISVPSNFTWTISFEGVNAGVGESAGLSLYGPPKIGSGFLDYWARNGNDWALKTVSGEDASFGALINGTPVFSTGITLTAPASFALEAIAADSDGSITRVEFYSGATLIGTANTPPYRIQLKSVGAGSNSFVAKAYDNQGADASSAPVQVTVNPEQGVGGDEGVLSYTWAGDKLTVAWSDKYKGQVLQTSGTLLNPVWKDVDGSSQKTSVVVSSAAGALYFRLVKAAGTPGDSTAPKLALALSGNNLLISWPLSSTGYRLEATDSLLAPRWDTVSSANNSAVVPKASASRFFRLSKP